MTPPTFKESLRYDLVAGFLVFLIALPLCLGISMASGYPPIAGIVTAIVGGIIAPFVSNSELTIKGPAAGLIVIVLGAVTELDAVSPGHGYVLALGVSVVAGMLQIAFALARGGSLSEFFPKAAVHGMLAAIGIIIAAKQVHVLLGVSPSGKSPFQLIGEIPHSVRELNPEIAGIGIVSLVLLFLLPAIRHPIVKKLPAPVVVLAFAIVTGEAIDLQHDHGYSIAGHEYDVGPRYLVDVPAKLLAAVTLPDFSAVLTGVGIKYVIMLALVGSLESLLSANAIDLLDPWKRKTDMNRDLLAIGVGNTFAALCGGLPMISEIVRSSANINNGARTRLANLFHGLFLLGLVAAVPGLIHMVPFSALAAMLVYTGYRLASPKEFVHTYKVGVEQLAIFTSTVIATLATDLLIGIAVGIFVKLALHVARGAPLRSLFRAPFEVVTSDGSCCEIRVSDSAVFSNWIPLKRRLTHVIAHHAHIRIDFGTTHLVDHTVMSKLVELSRELERHGKALELVGLEQHEPVSSHPASARRKTKGRG